MSSSVGAATEAQATDVAAELSARQRETVDRLVAAAVEEVRAVGFGGLTVRNVAARAGVAPATAYTYFDSKEHLVSEVFWRRLAAMPWRRHDRRHSAASRVSAMLREVAMVVADEPELAAACTVSLLADDPAVRRLRDRIGGDIHLRIVDALAESAAGPTAGPATAAVPGTSDAAVVGALELAYSGAMLQAGTGHLAYDDLGDRLAEAAELILGGRR